MRKRRQELNQGKLFAHIISRDGVMLCDAEQSHRFVDPKKDAGATRAARADGKEGIL